MSTVVGLKRVIYEATMVMTMVIRLVRTMPMDQTAADAWVAEGIVSIKSIL